MSSQSSDPLKDCLTGEQVVAIETSVYKQAFYAMPSTKPRSTRERDPSARKVRILAAAGAAFAKGGFAGASLREISGKARVNLASINYYFGSKEEGRDAREALGSTLCARRPVSAPAV